MRDMYFKCLDNSGVKLVKCLKVFGFTEVAMAGDLLTVSVKHVIPKKKIKKGQICKAIVVRLKNITRRDNDFNVQYMDNYIIILKKNDLIPIGTRVFGSVYYELRKKGYMKLISLAAFIL